MRQDSCWVNPGAHAGAGQPAPSWVIAPSHYPEIPCWAIIVKMRCSSCQQQLSTDFRNVCCMAFRNGDDILVMFSWSWRSNKFYFVKRQSRALTTTIKTWKEFNKFDIVCILTVIKTDLVSYSYVLRPCDVIWRHGSRSTLAQVMACCLTALSHYLNQCWLMISEVLWHSPDSNFTENTSDIYCSIEFVIY